MDGYTGTLRASSQATSGQARKEDAASVYRSSCAGTLVTFKGNSEGCCGVRPWVEVIGHVKTCLVFFFGWVCFNAPVTYRNIMGRGPPHIARHVIGCRHFFSRCN